MTALLLMTSDSSADMLKSSQTSAIISIRREKNILEIMIIVYYCSFVTLCVIRMPDPDSLDNLSPGIHTWWYWWYVLSSVHI